MTCALCSRIARWRTRLDAALCDRCKDRSMVEAQPIRCALCRDPLLDGESRVATTVNGEVRTVHRDCEDAR